MKHIALRLDADKFKMFDEERRILSEAEIVVLEIDTDDPGEIIQYAENVDALLVASAKINKKIIDSLKKCKVISRYGTGVDNIDVNEATLKGIVVSYVPDFCINEMADHTLALLLALSRRLFKMHKIVEEGTWDRQSLIKSFHRISGKQLGLIGFGNTAKAVALRAKPFGLNIVVTHRKRLDQEEYKRYQVEPVSLELLLKESDFISIHCPLNEDTKHLIGENEFKMMKESAILINIARGAIVDEAALANALRKNWISGAGLDVFEHINVFAKPGNRPSSPLFGLENTAYTPHVAGTSLEAEKEASVKAASEAVRVLSGKRPINCANPDVIPWYN